VAAPLHQTLADLAAIASIRGDSASTATFTTALNVVRGRNIASDADLEPLLESPPADIQPDALKLLRHMYDAGAWVLFESALADLPADLRWLFESGAVTVAQLATLHSTLGITTAADLGAEIGGGRVRGLPGFSEATEQAIAAALPSLRATIPRLTLGQATTIAEAFLAPLRATPGVVWAEPVGSLRRGQDTVGDVEIVAPTRDPNRAIRAILETPEITRCLHHGRRRVYVITNRIQVGVRCPPPDQAGALQLHLTGSVEHLRKLRSVALDLGFALHRGGLARGADEPLLSETEEQIYSAMDLPWIPPELREGTQEVDRARGGSMPALIARDAIRGDLHMHTEYSDGRDSVEAMVKASVALKYEYIAITDHSPHSAASRNLSLDGVKKQAEEIARLRTRYPQIEILHGCEVDILLDGRLDFSDRVLERFDIVLASLHEHGGHSPDDLMRRYLGAMRNPLVTLITHPTNRVLPHRPGYELDYDRLFAAAHETGTALEIDGAPAHLDLDGGLARRAITAGAIVAIDSDCHRAELLDRQMRFGILTARRGWVEPRHVLNTRSIAEVRAFIAAKRGR
jgi:DNA polymerase (family 10)